MRAVVIDNGAAMIRVLPANQTRLLCAESGGGHLSDGDQVDLLVYSKELDGGN